MNIKYFNYFVINFLLVFTSINAFCQVVETSWPGNGSPESPYIIGTFSDKFKAMDIKKLHGTGSPNTYSLNAYYQFTITNPMYISIEQESNFQRITCVSYLQLVQPDQNGVIYWNPSDNDNNSVVISLIKTTLLPVGTYTLTINLGCSYNLANEVYSTIGFRGSPTMMTSSVFDPDESLDKVNDQNYIVSVIPLVTTDAVFQNSSSIINNEVIDERELISGIKSTTTYQYYDGFGLPIQTVQKGIISSSGKDLVNMTEYDSKGREYKQWLPTPSVSNDGSCITPTIYKQSLATIYANDTRSFNETLYENSPLNRVLGKRGAGQSWNNHLVSVNYLSNSSSSEVINFNVNGSQLQRDGYYTANTLSKIITTDEDNKITSVYKNKLGQVVMKRSSADVDTYYVYNDLGQLCFVLPPIASDQLKTLSTTIAATNDNALGKYGYAYTYDERGNCIQKKLPGCEPIYMIYDYANRLIISQDGNQRVKPQWMVTKYDVLGRVLYNGILNREVSQLEKDFINHNIVIESYTGSTSFYGTGYSNDLFKSEIIPLTVSYYDNYDFISLNGISLKWEIPITGYGTQYANAKGLLTGMRTYILDKAGTNYTTNAMYYDDRGRVVQTHTKNHLGGYDNVYNQYDFIGHITKTYKEHSQNTSTVITELYRNVYDQAGRLVLTRYKLSTNDTITLVSNSYDDLGRLVKRKRHNDTDTETIDYNIRNWTTKITSGTFIEELIYITNSISNIFSCFNGNIAATTWTYNGVKKAYTYTYNDLNQLTIAQGYQVEGNYLLNPNNKEQFYYDKQGNIVTLTRQKDNNSKLLDDLSFHYNGNQVTSVDDYSGSLNLYATKEYYEKARANNEMSYDPNGNMIKDLDRDIVTIQYNILNLPEIIQFKNGNQIINKYDASGQKLRTDYFTRITAITPIDPGKICTWTYTANEVDQTGTAYVDNKEYAFSGSQSGIFTLKRIHNAEGYVDFNWGSTNYNYYRRDHLGNIREVWGKTPGGFLTVQQTQYYPSGLPWTEGTGASLQPFKYNNKEFIEMHGYDTYDYGARGYYPAMGRFTSVDPLAEKYYSISPYAYCKGNPMNMIDILGLDPVYRGGKFYDNGEEVTWDYVYNWMQNHNSIAATYHFKTKTSGDAEITKTGQGNIGNTFYVNGQKYTANSYATLMGKDDKNNDVGDFSDIVSLSSDDIVTILGQAASVIFDEYHNNVEAATMGESIGGKLDYKKSIYGILDISIKKKVLFQIDGIVYNPNETGNYLWGLVLQFYGSFISPNTIAELGTRGRHDERWEQKAITAGRAYGSQLQKAITPELKQRILQRRLEFSR